MDTKAQSRRSSISLIHMSPDTTLAAEKDPANTPESQSRPATLDCGSTVKSTGPAADLLGQDIALPYLDGGDQGSGDAYYDSGAHSSGNHNFKFATMSEERLHIARLSGNKPRFVAIRVVRMDGQAQKSIIAEVRVPTSISSFTQLYKKIETALKLSLPVRELIPLANPLPAAFTPHLALPVVESVSHLEDKQLYYVTTINDLRGKSLYNKIVEAAKQAAQTAVLAEEHMRSERSLTPLSRRKTAASFQVDPLSSSTPPLVDKSNEKTPLSNRRRMSSEASSLSAGAVRVSRADASAITEDGDAENYPHSYYHHRYRDDEDLDDTTSQGFSRYSHGYPRTLPALCEPRNKPIVVKVARVPRGSTGGRKSWVDFKILNNVDTFEALFPLLERALKLNTPVKDVFTESGKRLEHFSELTASGRYLVQTITDVNPKKAAAQ